MSRLLLVGTQGSSWFLVVSGWFSYFLLDFMFLYVYLFGFHCSSLFFGWFYLVSWLFIGFSRFLAAGLFLESQRQEARY